MARRKRSLPTGFTVSQTWVYGDVPDDVSTTYVLRQLQMVTVGHLWWKRTVPQLVEIMRNDSIDVLVDAAWMTAGAQHAQAHVEATR